MRASGWAAQLVLVLALQLGRAAQGGAVAAATGEAGFAAALGQAPLVMVKFFHPACPHCQAIRAMYDTVARALMADGATLRFAQVDVSRRANGALAARHAPDGVPTLKLYKRGVLLAAYDGARDEKALSRWLRQHVRVYTAPVIHQLADEPALARFLADAREAPVVLALNPAPPHTDADMRIERYAAAARDAPGPPVLFARVPHPSLLVPDRKRYEPIANVYAATPYAAAVRNASDFNTDAQWWFPAVLGGEPLHAFVAAATLPRDGSAVLTKYNAPALTASARPILYVFGSKPAPGATTRKVMRKLARAGGDDLLVVYAHDSEFETLSRHVGVEDVKTDEQEGSSKTRYVLYRTANRKSERRAYRGVKIDGDFEKWLRKFMVEHGRFPMARGLAGVVNIVSKTQLGQILEHDGRIVLLQVCGEQCDSDRMALKETARMLKADARAVVVVEYSGDETVQVNGEKVGGKRPYLALVLPGAKPHEVKPYRVLEDVRRAVLSISSDHDDVLVNEASRFGEITINHVGLLLTVLGIALTIQNQALTRWRRKRGGRGGLTPESAKSV